MIKHFFKKKYLFIYLILAALGLRCCTQAFSSCGERGLLFLAVHGLLIAVASLVVEHGGCRVQAQWLWRTGLVAQWHVGSSWTRAQTRVPCTGRQILNHCTTREVPKFFNISFILRVRRFFSQSHHESNSYLVLMTRKMAQKVHT